MQLKIVIKVVTINNKFYLFFELKIVGKFVIINNKFYLFFDKVCKLMLFLSQVRPKNTFQHVCLIKITYLLFVNLRKPIKCVQRNYILHIMRYFFFRSNVFFLC